jgi:Zn-dependent protease
LPKWFSMLGPESYGERLETIGGIVRSRLPVKEVAYVEGVLTFRLLTRDIKERFREVYYELTRIGFVPAAVEVGGQVELRVFPYSQPQTRRSPWPLVLFLATLTTIFLDGAIRSGLLGGRALAGGGLLEALLYTVGIMTIIGIHELGHKISARHDSIASSLPYFIPGIPGLIPTFGAVIFQRGPVRNRDDLFDLGVSGPVAGFLAGLVVIWIAFSQAQWVERSVIMRMAEEGAVTMLPSPLVFQLMGLLFSPGGDVVPVFPAVGFAAWLGMVVTSLNLLPAWQLDGGRIFRSLTSFRTYRILSYATVLLLFVTGYYYFSLMLLLFMMNPIDFPPLDMVSPLSKMRRVAMIGVVALAVVTFVVLPSPLLNLLRI